MNFVEFLKKNFATQLIIRSTRLLYYPVYKYRCKQNSFFNILNGKDTVNNVVMNQMSIARFGDGEFNLMYKSKGIGFQDYSDKLGSELRNIIQKKGKIMIGIPHGFQSTQNDKWNIKSFWWAYLAKNNQYIVKMVKESKQAYFADASFTRVVTELKNKKKILEIVENAQNIWNNKNVILVEGKGTRFGVGNGLLNNACTVNRIIAPEKNAYDSVDQIEIEVQALLKKIDRNVVVLLALGPTATVLVGRLYTKVQCVDIGHFDLQYEFFRNKKYHAIKIKDRYDNESMNGNSYTENNDNEYLQQIYATVTKK